MMEELVMIMVISSTNSSDMHSESITRFLERKVVLTGKYITQVPDGYIYVDNTRGLIVVVNAIAHKILQLLGHEEMCVNDLILAFQDQYHFQDKQLVVDIVKFLEEAGRCGIVRFTD